MKRYVLTGAPGSGKTILIRALEMGGFRVVEEAATDLIALEQAQGKERPWEEPDFLDSIVGLQRQRMRQCEVADAGVSFTKLRSTRVSQRPFTTKVAMVKIR